jgi:hypothetical protein
LVDADGGIVHVGDWPMGTAGDCGHDGAIDGGMVR